VDHLHAGAAEGRAIWQAHDIDGVTMLTGANLSPGDIVEARVKDVVDDVDLAATVVRVISSAAAQHPEARPARALPLISTGSYGR
jgi:hypothetical protein